MPVEWKGGLCKHVFLDRLLASWDSVLTRYEEALGNVDQPFVHSERSNVGTLAVAADRLGAFVYVEPHASRRGEMGKGTAFPDLYVQPDIESEGFYFEAKFLPPNPTLNYERLRNLTSVQLVMRRGA